jgi:V/A-type H+-transporting ATPase subunit I
MIVPMKRLTLMCLASEQAGLMEALREMGAVHLRPVQPPAGRDIDRARARLDRVRGAQASLPCRGTEEIPDRAERNEQSPEQLLDEISTIQTETDSLREQLEAFERERERILPLGQFDPASIRDLRDKGVWLKLFAAGRGEPLSAPEGIVLCEVGRDRSTRYYAALGAADFEIEAREVIPPEQSLASVQDRIGRIQASIDAHDARMAEISELAATLEPLARKAEDEVRFLEAMAGMGSVQEIAFVQGYCPAETLDPLVEIARRKGWGLLADDPGPDEEVPTLVRYPRWVRSIQAVFGFINVLPGYREVDISAWFLLFLSLFFALIVGDAGYGVVFLLLTVVGRRVLRKAPPSLWTLSYIMSVATIAWGVLVGNYFGIVVLPTALRDLRVEWLVNDRNVMALCFLIGAAHLTIAHAWNALRLIRKPEALAQIGWLGTTWTMFFAARALVLGEAFPGLMSWVFLISVVLIALFMTPFRRFKAEWSGHARLPLSLVSNFVDLVSYVRLFAVGVATLALASAFNDMGMAVAADGIVSRIAGVLILFLGHTLNILLALLGVLVHGIRLNTLEFSGHLGLEWKGIPYRPFARV